jgi:carbamate kinase
MEKSKTIVVALGGNALQKHGEASAVAQQRVAAETAQQLIPLIQAGHRLVIVHGNGPQVGNIVLHEEAINTPSVPTLPFDSCGAMSQGLIGYWLQQALDNALRAHNADKPVATVVAQMVVDVADPAFANPTKPIGPFYETETMARQVAAERGFTVVEDAGRGWRRVVPSPKPQELVEKQAVKTLLGAGCVVITAGGGGVPVVREHATHHGVEAVIDKDFSAALVADQIDADELVILTAVDAAMIRFGTPEQEEIRHATPQAMQQYIDQGYFAKGSMLPKVQAAMNFANQPGRKAVIASLERVAEALAGSTGTTIAYSHAA